MILLSFFSLAFALGAWGSLLYSYLCVMWGRSFVLQRAALVMVHEGSESEEYQFIDITREMQRLHQDGHMGPQYIDVLPCLAAQGPRTEVQLALRACHSKNHAPPADESPPLPLCFVDVTYTMRGVGGLRVWWTWKKSLLTAERPFRCLYPIYDFYEQVQYPPPCRWMTSESSLISAMLSIRLDQPHGMTSSKRSSCYVTDRVRLLEGPQGDFHRRSSVGYHLRKHILKVVLLSDIQALADSLNGFSQSSVDPPGGGRPKSPLQALTKNTVSVRFQFKGPPRRVEVVTLQK